MPSPVVDSTIQAAAAQTSLNESVLVYVAGAAAAQQAAVDQALANGATAAELAPVQAAVDEMKAKGQAVADALIANTPVTPVQSKAKKP